MITNPTVFITGAGASYEYRFPLGWGLVEQIISAVKTNADGMRNSLVAASFREGDLDNFRKRLKNSDSRSIDTFLEGADKKTSDIGKAAIALIILKSEAVCKSEELLFGAKPRDHWMGYVWNLMRSGSDKTTFHMNKVSFVTFNYERTIEEYFTTVLMNAFNLTPKEAEQLRRDTVEVVHLHGGIADREFGQYMTPFPGTLVRPTAAGIKVIHDTVTSADPAFQRAWGLLSQASIACLLGFGYDPVNIRRLKIHEYLGKSGGGGGSKLYGTTYGMGQAEVATAQKRRQRGATFASLKAEEFLRQNVPLD